MKTATETTKSLQFRREKMGMKLKFLPICTQNPKTTSFRVRKGEVDEIYKTINSVYFDPADADSVETTQESWFTNSAESQSTESAESVVMGGDSSSDDVEEIIRGAQRSGNQRLLFEPGGERSPRLVSRHEMVAVDSRDPHEDFKKSMAEMAASLGVGSGDIHGLKELLGWYLKVNEESNHGYILGAFVDLVCTILGTHNRNNNNDKERDEEVAETSFSSAAAVSLSSCATASARLILSEDSDHII